LKTRLTTQTVILIIIIGITLTTTAQNQQNTGKAPTTGIKPGVNYSYSRTPLNTTTAYGLGNVVGQFLSMPIPAGDPLTLIAPMTAPGFFSSATFGPDGTLYFTDATTDELYIVDIFNGTLTLVGSTNAGGLNGITYDWANEVFWGVTDTALYTVDVTTGSTTMVGPFGLGGDELMIDVAVDCDGNMYAYDINSVSLYSIDPATGTATLIGALGYDANFGQGMSYDHSTGILYLSAFNGTTNSGQLRTVDVASGMTTLVFDWGFEQIAPFAIDSRCGPPCPVSDPSNPNPSDEAVDVPIDLTNISWTNAPEATEIELFFGPVGSVVSVYSGVPITSFQLNTLEYNTTYMWIVKLSDGNCWVTGPTWTFLTEDDPNIIHLFVDDFEDQTLTNWDITNNGGDCVWTPIELSTRPYMMPRDAMGWGLAADSDSCGSETTLLSTATMINPLNLSDYSNIWIEFDNDWRTIDTQDKAYVEISTDGGDTWITVVSWLGVDQRDTHEVWDVSSYAALRSDVRFRFRVIQPGWDWWWVVDNFSVYSDTTVVSVEDETYNLPGEFYLSQNYPNPFNPTTIIRFSIPAVETGNAPYVKLIIYDVLGNEVATLINEEKEAGIYEVEFSAQGGSASGGDAYNLTSGIYFYRLTVGDPSASSGQSFTATKKMIILK